MVTIDFEKYKNDGWGLSKKEFELLDGIIKSKLFHEPNKKINIVEFGSGRSTEFLVDLINDHQLPLNIYSFDDSSEYAYKGENPNLKLFIVPLVECTDESWEKMFNIKKYDSSLMILKESPVHTRQKNTFYMVEDHMLPDEIDILIVDGPHGNGRSLAYLRCHEKMKNYSTVLIDDASHYPFYDHLKRLNDVLWILSEQHIKEDKWVNGGDYLICQIKKS